MTLSDAIKIFGTQLRPHIIAATAEAAAELRAILATYPPEGPGNSPSNRGGRWYERGYGTRWRTGGRPTSEHLGASWKITQRSGDYVVQNSASYAVYTQGHLQTQIHQRTGWPTVEQAVAKTQGTLARAISQQMQKMLAQLHT